MLGIAIPDVLQFWFIDVVRSTSMAAWQQRLAYAGLCSVYLIALAFILRRLCLELDAYFALNARRQGGLPGLTSIGAGLVACAQFWTILGATVVFLCSAALFELVRNGILATDTESALSNSVRFAQTCLRPATRKGVNPFAQCISD